MVAVSLGRWPRKVEWDTEKIRKLYSHKNKKYERIHTHPEGTPTPSPEDINTFLLDDNYKTMIIAPLQENGKLRGYFILRKTKQTQNSGLLRKILNSRGIKKYKKRSEKAQFLEDPKLRYALEGLAKTHKLQYRYIPVEKSRENEKYLSKLFNQENLENTRENYKNYLSVLRNQKNLENTLAPSFAGISFLLSLFFLSKNLTGNTILNLSLSNQNIIGVCLFILCLVTLFIYFKKTKKLKKLSHGDLNKKLK